MKLEFLHDKHRSFSIDGGPPITIPNRTGPIITNFSDILIVPVKSSDVHSFSNFLAINKEGDIVWKFNEGNYLEVQHRFVHLLKENKDELWFKNIAGKEYRVDHKTGKVVKTNYENMHFACEDNAIIIGSKCIELEIPEGNSGQVCIKQTMSWRGKLLLVIYTTHDPKRINEFKFRYFQYLVAFSKSGKKLWQLCEIDLQGGPLDILEGAPVLRVATDYFVFDLDAETGKVINKMSGK